jgi:flagellar basal body P-ring protein FlgI
MKKSSINKITSLLVLSMFVTACFNTTSLPAGTLVYATLEINPGIGLMIDEDNQIAYAHALNADGEMVMLNLQLEGKHVNSAIDDITDEIIALQFMNQNSVNPQLNMDCLGTTEGVQNQIRSQIQNRVGQAFNGKMITMQTQTRTYTSSEIAEAAA